MTDAVPDWMLPLLGRAGQIEGGDLSRFLPPEDGSGRPSAVLIALTDTGDGAGPSVLLCQRAPDLRSHAGQVAFPGGSLDPTDATLEAAAVREAQEEIGLDPDSVQVVLNLPAIFIPVSGFVVTPVLAWWQHPHPVHPVDPGETARVELVPLAVLADPANRFRVAHPSGFTGPGFEAAGLFVWGFTAGLLDLILEFGGFARPWDPSVTRPLPDVVRGS